MSLFRQLSSKRHDKLVNFLGTGTSVTDGFLTLRIVMERYSGDLKRHVILAPRSPSLHTHYREFLHCARQCTEGLAFIHENNVIHRDVKPSNFLVNVLDIFASNSFISGETGVTGFVKSVYLFKKCNIEQVII